MAAVAHDNRSDAAAAGQRDRVLHRGAGHHRPEPAVSRQYLGVATVLHSDNRVGVDRAAFQTGCVVTVRDEVRDAMGVDAGQVGVRQAGGSVPRRSRLRAIVQQHVTYEPAQLGGLEPGGRRAQGLAGSRCRMGGAARQSGTPCSGVPIARSVSLTSPQ